MRRKQKQKLDELVGKKKAEKQATRALSLAKSVLKNLLNDKKDPSKGFS